MLRLCLILALSLPLRAGVLVDVGAGLGIAGQAINLGETVHALKKAAKATKRAMTKPKAKK
jgi:hypothetical protein